MKEKANPVEIVGCSSYVEVSQEETLLGAFLRHKIQISQSCEGMGTCGTCRVEVLAGLENCGERSEIEKEMAEDRGFLPKERLSCQTYPTGPIKLKINHSM